MLESMLTKELPLISLNDIDSSKTMRIFSKINYLLFFSTSVISFNQKILLEKNFINKVMDNDDNLNMDNSRVSMGHDSLLNLSYMDASPYSGKNSLYGDSPIVQNYSTNNLSNLTESDLVSQILSKIFKLLDFYLHYLSNSINNVPIDNLIFLQQGIFYFLKNFAKLFLSKKLDPKYINLFPNLCEILNLKDNSLILSFIISFLIEVSKCHQNSTIHNNTGIKTSPYTSLSGNNFQILPNVIKIFQIIINNVHIEIDGHTGEKILYAGKIGLQEDFLKSILSLHEILIKLDPISLGKYRKIFYKSMSKIILMKENSNNNQLFNNLLDFYNTNIKAMKGSIKGNDEVGYTLLGYVKDLEGIVAAITLKQEYKNFITKMFEAITVLGEFYKSNCHIAEVNISMLKLIVNISDNSSDRICFPLNSVLPVQFLNLACSMLTTYKYYLSTLPLDAKDDYIKHIKPVCLFIKIFKQFFLGRFVHFGSIISINASMIEDMFINLCELIFSIKLENFMGYIYKTNTAYYLLKVIFCEYINHFNYEKFSVYIDPLMKMIEEGTDSLDNVAIISAHQIIFEWGKAFIEWKRGSGDKNCFIYTLFSTFEDRLHLLLQKMLSGILNGEITSLSEISNSIFVLILIYDNYYLNLTTSLIYSKVREESLQLKLKSLFEGLFVGVRTTTDDANLRKFSKNLKDFANEIQGIM